MVGGGRGNHTDVCLFKPASDARKEQLPECDKLTPTSSLTHGSNNPLKLSVMAKSWKIKMLFCFFEDPSIFWQQKKWKLHILVLCSHP